MGRIEQNAELMEKLPRQYTGSQEIIQTKVMMDILAVLQDISISLAQLSNNFENVTQKTCENCKYDPNDKTDQIIACQECYDFSQWEDKDNG